MLGSSLVQKSDREAGRGDGGALLQVLYRKCVMQYVPVVVGFYTIVWKDPLKVHPKAYDLCNKSHQNCRVPWKPKGV